MLWNNSPSTSVRSKNNTKTYPSNSSISPIETVLFFQDSLAIWNSLNHHQINTPNAIKDAHQFKNTLIHIKFSQFNGFHVKKRDAQSMSHVNHQLSWILAIMFLFRNYKCFFNFFVFISDFVFCKIKSDSKADKYS